jgi:ubiquinone/menaquinone biosynthesis C-methylase UbiE
VDQALSKLVDQYSGQGASRYDEARTKTARFKAEEEAFSQLFQRANPKSVLDMPVGTGRWLPLYAKAQVRVVGIDASDDMLAEARRKVEGPAAERIKLLKADALDESVFRSLGERFDLVVCVRFLNWFSFGHVERVLKNLDLVASKHIVLGIGTWQGRPGSLRRAMAKFKLLAANARNRAKGKAEEHVHDPGQVLALTRKLGLAEVERRFIFSRNGRDSYLVLFEKPGSTPGER